MTRHFGIPAAVVLAAMAVAVGRYLFQPWLIFKSSTVSEDVPSVVPQTSHPAGPSDKPTSTTPRELATGTLISHEHSSSGSAKIIELPDGSRILRLEGQDPTRGEPG